MPALEFLALMPESSRRPAIKLQYEAAVVWIDEQIRERQQSIRELQQLKDLYVTYWRKTLPRA